MRHLFAAFVFLLVACSGGAPAPQSNDTTAPDTSGSGTHDSTAVTVTGTVRYFALEGGFFAIRGDDSVTYDPTNLAEAFREDGLRVRAELRLRPDMMGIHQVGPIVEIVEISRQ